MGIDDPNETNQPPETELSASSAPSAPSAPAKQPTGGTRQTKASTAPVQTISYDPEKLRETMMRAADMAEADAGLLGSIFGPVNKFMTGGYARGWAEAQELRRQARLMPIELEKAILDGQVKNQLDLQRFIQQRTQEHEFRMAHREDDYTYAFDMKLKEEEANQKIRQQREEEQRKEFEEAIKRAGVTPDEAPKAWLRFKFNLKNDNVFGGKDKPNLYTQNGRDFMQKSDGGWEYLKPEEDEFLKKAQEELLKHAGVAATTKSTDWSNGGLETTTFNQQVYEEHVRAGLETINRLRNGVPREKAARNDFIDRMFGQLMDDQGQPMPNAPMPPLLDMPPSPMPPSRQAPPGSANPREYQARQVLASIERPIAMLLRPGTEVPKEIKLSIGKIRRIQSVLNSRKATEEQMKELKAEASKVLAYIQKITGATNGKE